MNDDIAELLKPRDLSAWRAKMFQPTDPAFNPAAILALRDQPQIKKISQAKRRIARDDITAQDRQVRLTKAQYRQKKSVREANAKIDKETADVIIDQVCSYYEIGKGNLMTPLRAYRATTARQIAAYLMREMTDLSYSAISIVLGYTDYTTVRSSWMVIGMRVSNEKYFAADVNALRKRVQE